MPNTNKKKNSYANLRGIHRAVPIILLALSVFIALCFITKDTGAFGQAISGFLMGLFARAAYVLPVLIAIHAVFYASDFFEERLLSRIIFSSVALITLSAFIYAVSTIGTNAEFTPKLYYTNGQSGIGGGFIGSLIAYAIMKVFGTVGLIIIAILIIALYVTYFFAREARTPAKFFFFVLSLIASLFAFVEKLFKKLFEKRRKKKAAKAERRQHEKNADLYDDDFFAVDNGMAELSIAELGIIETRTRETMEENPRLSDKVHHKSETQDYPGTESNADSGNANANTERRTKRTVDFSYDGSLREDTKDVGGKKTDIVVESYEAPKKYGLDENAEDVFTKDFDPLDIAMNSSIALKPSSKAAPAEPAVAEYADPLAGITEEDIANARRNAEFEMKKKALADMYRRQEEVRRLAEEREREASAEAAAMQKTVEFRESATEDITEAHAATSFSETFEKPINTPTPAYEAPKYTEVRDTAAEDAEREERLKAYRRVASFNASTPEWQSEAASRVTPVSPAATPAYGYSDTPAYTPASSYNSEAYSPAKEEVPERPAEEKIRPYVSPAEYARPTYSAASTEEGAEALRIERTMLTSEPDEDEEDEGNYVVTDGYAEEDVPEREEIPEEEQNEDVKEYRKMFSIFNEDDKTEDESQKYEDDEGTVDDEDEPPFDVEEEKFAVKAEPEKEKPKGPDYSNYKAPSFDLMARGMNDTDEGVNEEIQENSEKLIDTLASFRVTASIKSVDHGPRITRYEVVPARGVKVSAVTNLFDDIALALAADGIRMEAPIPGKSAIGFEIPNKKPSTVYLRDLLETDEFAAAPSKTHIAIGKDVTGAPVFGDIAKMPHLLIAGATGMGKSVCINSIMISMLYKARPDEVKFIMIDPKKVEFNGYNGIPHLLIPVVTDPKQAAGALTWAVEQMEKRYEMIEKLCVRNIEAYNAEVARDPSLGEPMSKIVIVIDELNDLMIQVRDPVENLIMSIAQKARAAGIHLIIGTQRPSVNVITGVIKANIPSRIACKVSSNVDSRTILEQAGAEKLLNNGDMLFWPVGKPKPLRVQGAFVSDKEVEAVMKHLKSQAKGETYDSVALEEINRAAQKCIKKKDADMDRGDGDADDGDSGGYLGNQKFLDAVDLAISQGKISTSLIQRKIGLGYGKAAKFIDTMESLGIVSEPNGQKPRDVLISRDEWHEKLSRLSLD